MIDNNDIDFDLSSRFGKLKRKSPKFRKNRKMRVFVGESYEIKFLGIEYVGNSVSNPDGALDPEYPYVVFIHSIYGKVFGAVRAIDVQHALVAAQEIYHEYGLTNQEIVMSDGVTQIFNIEASWLTYVNKIKHLEQQEKKPDGQKNITDKPPDPLA